jgi:myo-inositol-1(or 4)-monophosphatase
VVTEVDLLLSKKISEISKECYPKVNYVDEEKASLLSFPAIIVDPIDGTKELSRGISECAVSVAYMNSSLIADPENFAMIYNPLNGFYTDSFSLKNQLGSSYCDEIRVLISRTEWSKKLYRSQSQVNFIPIGSIAYKLSLLAAGMFESVISYRNKSIWDIAAGSILVSQMGGSICNKDYQQINAFEEIELVGPFIWCREKKVLNKMKNLKV